MAFGVGRALSTPLMFINFCLYLTSAALAGWALNRNFDNARGVGEGYVGNSITDTFLRIALIACMVGLASVLAGTHHIRVWRMDSLAAAAATSLMAWLLTLLAMGLAAKEIHTGGGYRLGRLKVLEAFIIILSLTELLYLLSLHAGSFTSGAPGYVDGTYGPGHHTDRKIPTGTRV